MHIPSCDPPLSLTCEPTTLLRLFSSITHVLLGCECHVEFIVVFRQKCQVIFNPNFGGPCTGRLDRMSRRKWRETKQQPSRAGSGHQISCCLVSLHFLCDILSGRPVHAPINSARCPPPRFGPCSACGPYWLFWPYRRRRRRP